MTDDIEQVILDNARYLREIRPIDPAEITEYVEADVSTESVRRILRRHSLELGLIERAGIFEPAASTPVSVPFSGVERLPERYVRRVEEILADRFGKDWFAEETGDALRGAIRSFKQAYFGGETVRYESLTAAGYAIYHLPATYASTAYLLEELGRGELLSHRLRVLDVGAGVGGQALALHDYLPETALVEYVAIEPSDAGAEILAEVLEETHRNFHWTVHRSTIEAFEPDGVFDVIACVNVLSELSDPVATVARLSQSLSAEGTMLAIEPADERTSRGLRRIERHLLARRSELDVYAPTLRLWPNVQPTDDCWSFDRRPDIAIPAFQRRLDEGRPADADTFEPATREFVNVDVQFSYSVLRTDGRRRVDIRPSRKREMPLRQTGDHVGERVTTIAVKLSHSLAVDTDSHPLYVIGDGSQRTEHFAVLTQSRITTEAIDDAAYADVIVIRDGLVLWNADELAYNIVLDGQTTVDRIEPNPSRA